MHPDVAGLEAVFAALGARLYIVDVIEVRANRHGPTPFACGAGRFGRRARVTLVKLEGGLVREQRDSVVRRSRDEARARAGLDLGLRVHAKGVESDDRLD